MSEKEGRIKTKTIFFLVGAALDRPPFLRGEREREGGGMILRKLLEGEGKG